MFCGCFAIFCECFAVFPQKRTKHPKNIEKHCWKHTKNSQYARVLREFSKSKTFRLYCKKKPFTKHLQNTAKHRKTPQNSHKTHFVKLRRKTLQNARKTLEKTSQNAHNTAATHIARIRCFLAKYARSVAKAHNTNTQYTRTLREGGHVPAGGHLAGL